MLLALIVSHLFIFAAANPFHKYPFVFLLDVGNEELEKTNSEQIRISVPGGSVALRYPAIGDGNTISHVRVSGIDFGTHLKANIVDGGPGYKYVVLVFMGNPGVPYDAVVTVKTVTDGVLNIQNIGPITNKGDINQNEEDENNSAEDFSDAEVDQGQSKTSIQNSNAELMQSSANVYSYIENESIDESSDDDEDANEDNNFDKDNEDANDVIDSEELDSDAKNEYDEVSDKKAIHTPYADDAVQEEDDNNDIKGVEIKDQIGEDNGDEEISSSLEQSDVYFKAEPIVVDSNLYEKYKALKDHLNLGRDVYSQEDFQKSDIPGYQEDPLDYEDVNVAGSTYDDEELNNRADSNNNNYIDSDDSYAVAY